MALQLDYVLSISIEAKNVYAKIEQAITVTKKEIINEETNEIAETLKTCIRVIFYNSKTDRDNNKNPIESKSFLFNDAYILSLQSAYNLLKTHPEFNVATDILEE